MKNQYYITIIIFLTVLFLGCEQKSNKNEISIVDEDGNELLSLSMDSLNQNHKPINEVRQYHLSPSQIESGVYKIFNYYHGNTEEIVYNVVISINNKEFENYWYDENFELISSSRYLIEPNQYKLIAHSEFEEKVTEFELKSSFHLFLEPISDTVKALFEFKVNDSLRKRNISYVQSKEMENSFMKFNNQTIKLLEYKSKEFSTNIDNSENKYLTVSNGLDYYGKGIGLYSRKYVNKDMIWSEFVLRDTISQIEFDSLKTGHNHKILSSKKSDYFL